MTEYQKIESLYRFDNEKRKYVKEFYNPIIEYLAPLEWYGTEKIDGTNIRIHWDGHRFEIGGRTDKAQLPNEIVKLFNEKFNVDMEVYFEQNFGEKDVYLFCEGHGGTIQNGAYKCPVQLVGFDIMINETYLDKMAAKKIFESLDIPFVPILKFDCLYDAIEYVKNERNSILHDGNALEGLVCVPTQRIYDHQGNRIIVKIKYEALQKLS